MYCLQGRNDNSCTAKICLKMNKKQHTKKLIIKILIILDFKILSMYFTILNKSENATLQLSIFYEKVLDKKYLLKLNNVAQTSSK